MKLQVLQKNLSHALNITSRFASAKAQLPILTNLLFQTKKNKLVISATNLETSISLSLGARIKEEGSITIPSQTIASLVSNLNPGQIDLESKKEKLKISSAGFKSTLSGINPADFPTVSNTIGKNALQIQTGAFLQGLSKVLFAVSTDETRPVLTGVLIIIKKDILVLVSTDGFRLSQKKIKLKGNSKNYEGKTMIIPKNTLTELSRIKGDSEVINFSYKKDESQVIFGIADAILSSRIIEGEFPDFERIIPKESGIKVNVDKEDFLQAVKLASVFAKDSANMVKVAVKKDAILVSAESKLAGSQEMKVDAKVKIGESGEKEELTIAFNYRFLIDFLNSVESADVGMEFSGPNAPALFIDSKDDDFLHIIMPVKLQS
jgi:DNA polymerase-3 subunit beta